MRVVTLTNGQFAENTYLVIDESSRQAAVIDPGEDSGLILARIDTERVAVATIWLTHAHLDHVAGVDAVHSATGAPVWLHKDDLPLYHAVEQQAAAFGLQVDPVPEPDDLFTVGDTVAVGAIELVVRHTPGHSPGSVSLIGGGVAFVGDVLFAGSVGRVDLPGGDPQALLASIRSELLTLPDQTVVYSGHGPATTIGQERQHNPFVTGASPLV